MRRRSPCSPGRRGRPRRRPPAPGASRRSPGSPAASSTANQPDHHALRDQKQDDRQDRAEVEREAAAAERRYEAPEDVQVRVRHLLDEAQGGAQVAVVGHPGDPTHQHADEDQDQIDEEHGSDIVGDVAAPDRCTDHGRIRSIDACTACSKAFVAPPRSSASRPASVLPPGEATAARREAGWRVSKSCAVPASASRTSSRDSSSSRPSRAPASASTSATRAKYAGEQPMTAVAGSSSRSSSSTVRPSSPSSASTSRDSSPEAPSGGVWQISPRLTSTARFGMARNRGASGKTWRSRATGVAPRTDSTAVAALPRASAAVSSAAGFTASTTRSESLPSWARFARAPPPSSSASAAARPEPASENSITSGPPSPAAHPRAIAAAMFPAPANPTFIAGKRSRQGVSGLVEEALLDQASLLLGRYLHVARRQQEGLVGDLLHAALERVRETGGEVDQPLGELGVGRLQVQDHRNGLLELVRDLLGVVEAVRRDQVDANVGASVPPHGPQHARAPASRRLVVGEDVVDLVATAATVADRPDRPGTRRVVVLPLSSRVGLVQVRLAVLRVLGEPEIDECTVPCVAEGHRSAYVRFW